MAAALTRPVGRLVLAGCRAERPTPTRAASAATSSSSSPRPRRISMPASLPAKLKEEVLALLATRPASAAATARQAARVPGLQRPRRRRAQERRPHQLSLPQGGPLRASGRSGPAHAAADRSEACCSSGATPTRSGVRASSWRWSRRRAPGERARPVRLRSHGAEEPRPSSEIRDELRRPLHRRAVRHSSTRRGSSRSSLRCCGAAGDRP